MTSAALCQLPAVGVILQEPPVRAWIARWGHEVLVGELREVLEGLRSSLRKHDPSSGPPPTRDELLAEVLARLTERLSQRSAEELGPVLNATGIVLHTSLGRAPLSVRARELVLACSQTCNLEVDLQTGDRLSRGHQVTPMLRELTGAEGALVVNNNAAATVLVLAALAKNREVVISRGQLVEIGGSFRLPEIFATSGAILREVGSTNRTRLDDYRGAVTEATAGLMRVHPSNYRIRGFVESPEIAELVEVAREAGVWVVDDIGSGCLVDTTQWGLEREPTFTESLAAGADLVLGSGDKLLGGPQCGIILGRADLVRQLAAHPLARAFRIDKLTLAALQGTLEAYRLGRHREEIPVLARLGASVDALEARARAIVEQLAEVTGHPTGDKGLWSSCGFRISVQPAMASVGGGSLPEAELPSWMILLQHAVHSCDSLARELRTGRPRVYGRISRGGVCLDLRSLAPGDDTLLVDALVHLTGQSSPASGESSS